MKNLCIIALVAFLFSSCKNSGTADKKAPELANEMCSCFDSFQQSLSEDGKALMKTIALSENPKGDLMTGITKLKPEEQQTFATKLQSIADRNSDVYKCMEAFDSKHAKETTANRNDLIAKILVEMRKNGNCYVGAAVINMNPKEK